MFIWTAAFQDNPRSIHSCWLQNIPTFLRFGYWCKQCGLPCWSLEFIGSLPFKNSVILMNISGLYEMCILVLFTIYLESPWITMHSNYKYFRNSLVIWEVWRNICQRKHLPILSIKELTIICLLKAILGKFDYFFLCFLIPDWGRMPAWVKQALQQQGHSHVVHHSIPCFTRLWSAIEQLFAEKFPISTWIWCWLSDPLHP